MVEHAKAEDIQSKMYLPDDVLGLLHEFTRPVFKYIHEFNAYKRIHQHDCVLLMDKLSREPDPVIEYLRDYLAVVEQKEAVNADYRAHMARSRKDLTVAELLQYRVDQEWLHEQTEYASWLACWYHHELQRELVGRDVIQNEWFPYERTPLYEEDDDDYSLRRWEWSGAGWVATQVGWT